MRRPPFTGLTVAAGLATALLALVGAPAAHADEAGFLNELHQNGFQGWAVGGQQMPDGVLVAQGYMACNRFKLGEKPDQLLAQLGGGDVETGRALISAAQHNLCPETLP